MRIVEGRRKYLAGLIYLGTYARNTRLVRLIAVPTTKPSVSILIESIHMPCMILRLMSDAESFDDTTTHIL